MAAYLSLLSHDTYDDYLDSFFTKEDIRYLRQMHTARELVILGYRSAANMLSSEEFEQHKREAYDHLFPTVKRTNYFFSFLKSHDDEVLHQLIIREFPNRHKSLSVSQIQEFNEFALMSQFLDNIICNLEKTQWF